MSESGHNSEESSLDMRRDAGLPDWAQLAFAGACGLLVLVFAVLFSALGPAEPFKAAFVPFAAVVIVVTAIVRPRWIFYGYISACMVFPHELEEIFIPLGFMKLYPQDLLFVYLVILCLLRATIGKGKLHGIRFNRLMVIYVLLGIWAAAVGLWITGNSYNNVFGDFRRSFFYFLMYFFALILTSEPEEIRYLKLALFVGSVGAICRGIILFSLGDFVTRRFGDAAHIMTHFEVTFSTYVIFLGLTHLTAGTKRKVFWILLAVAGSLVVVIGNFRTCWVGLMGGLAMLLFLLPFRERKRLAVVMACAIVVGAIGLALLWDVPVSATHSTVGENIAKKANIDKTSSDTNVKWRMDSYKNALSLWETQPIIGRGLGEELEFITTSSTGHPMMAIGHRVHNSYLWFFMSLGVSGFAVLVYIQWRYMRQIVGALRHSALSKDSRITLVAGTAFYATILTCACFDVYLESAPPITLISVVMAMSMLTIRYDNGTSELKKRLI